MNMLLRIHSAIRWVIIAVAVLAIIGFTIGWAGIASFKTWTAAWARGLVV
jgi:hypothetical protein